MSEDLEHSREASPPSAQPGEQGQSEEHAEPRLLCAGEAHPLSNEPDARLISVLIPVKNGASELRELLPRVLSQRCDARVEIVAVDSGSSDETVEVLRQFSATVGAIDPRSFNHGLTRNLAATYARGNVLVFVNQLTLPADDCWLANLVAPLDYNPQVAGVYSRILPRADADPLTQKDVLVWPPLPSIRGIEDPLQYERLSPIEFLDLISFHTVSAAIRPEVLAQIPFRQVRTIGEDMLWAKEALEGGYKIQYEPTSVVLHSHNYSYAEILGRYFDHGVANIELLRQRHHFGHVGGDFEGVRLHANEMVARIAMEVGEDWRFLGQRLPAYASDLRQWRITSLIRRTAKFVGVWLGSNTDDRFTTVEELLRSLLHSQVADNANELWAFLGGLMSSIENAVEGAEQRTVVSADEVLTRIAVAIGKNWQTLAQNQPSDERELEEAQIKAGIRGIAEVVEQWIRTHPHALRSHPDAFLSLTNQVRVGGPTEQGSSMASDSTGSAARGSWHRDIALSPTRAVTADGWRVDTAGLFESVDSGSALIRSMKLELRSRVRERDEVIRSLQLELHDKVGEANQVIANLQSELQEKVADRDQIIGGLQTELQEKVADRDRIICALQAELQEKVADRDRIIGALQAELAAQVGTSNRATNDLTAQSDATSGTYHGTSPLSLGGRRVGRIYQAGLGFGTAVYRRLMMLLPIWRD
jgi:rhamnosyltransferase